MQAKAWVADNDWHFRVEVGESCDEEWRFTAMCVDNNWSSGISVGLPAASRLTQ